MTDKEKLIEAIKKLLETASKQDIQVIYGYLNASRKRRG